MAKISKQKVKSYLDHDGKDLVDLMKKKIEDKDKWTDFKDELISAIIEYSAKPTFAEKQKLQDLVEGYYLSNSFFARESLDRILIDLEIREVENSSEKDGKGNNSNSNSIAYRREIYEKLGIDCPDVIIARAEEELQRRRDQKYGIVRKTNKATELGEPKNKKSSEKKPKKDNKPKEDGKIVKAIKKAYFRITASVIMAPGEVPPEILAENRDMLNTASVKLDKMAEDVKKARDIIINQNKSSLKNIPEAIKDVYDQMVNEKLDENGLDNFAETLNQLSDEKVDDMREAFGKFDESLRKALEDLSRAELIKLSRNFRDLTKMNPKSRIYAIAKRLQEHPELLSADSMDRIDTASKEQIALERISQETKLRHKAIVIEEIQGQFLDIQDIIAEYDEKEAADGKLAEGDKKKRAIVLKVARVKVESLKKAGLSSVIEDGNKKSKGLLRRAKDILMPQLENARNRGKKRLKKEHKQHEDPVQ